MMEPREIEEVLKNAKFRHLSEATLISYHENRLDEVGRAMADAHLNVCLLCEKELDFLKGEQDALASYEVTETDRALIRRVLDQTEAGQNVPTTPAPSAGPRARLAAGLNELTVAWIAHFSGRQVGGDDAERFRFETEALTVWSEVGTDSNLTVQFSSPDLVLEGETIRFRLGPFTEDVTLEREGDLEVNARVKIPQDQRARKMKDFSVEVVSLDT